MRTLAERLDTNEHLNSSHRIELELRLTKLNEHWRKLSNVMNTVRKNATETSSKWEQFERLSKDLMDWAKEMQAKIHEEIMCSSSSSIERLKEEFEHVVVSL